MTHHQDQFGAYTPSFVLTNDNALFRIDPHVVPIQSDTGQITGFHCGWRHIYFDPDQLGPINGVLKRLDQGLTFQEIVRDVGLSAPMVRAVLQTLYELAIIVLVSDDPMPSLAFYHHITHRMRAHRHRMRMANPIVTPETQYELSRRKLLGFLVEAYHFAAAAAGHISLAIASANTRHVQNHFTKYLSEEYWHDRMLAQGLEKAGIDPTALQASVPSFPLMGIIHCLRHLAQTDLQAYGICLSLSEGHTSPGAMEQHRDEIWSLIQSLNLVPDETIEAFVDHDMLDFDGQHDNVPKILFEDNATLSPERQKELLKTATLYLGMVQHAYDYLSRHYADFQGDPYFKCDIP